MYFAVKGNIVFTPTPNEFVFLENGFIVVKNQKVVEVTKNQPDIENIIDYKDKIIIPSFVDLHTHAAQTSNYGLGCDMELIEWLKKYTFPEESKFSDTEYARKVYTIFIEKLWTNGILRSVVMPTLHFEATKVLFELFKKANLSACFGKVNMDDGLGSDFYEDTEQSVTETKELIKVFGSDKLLKYAITPRFVLSCSNNLLDRLGKLSQDYDLPVHSHLDENKVEIQMVSKRFPQISTYAEVYEHYKLLGKKPTVMAHCIYMADKEIKIFKNPNCFIAHCPTSNINLCSGIMPAKRYLKEGLNVGLGSDVSGGYTWNMFGIMREALNLSKVLHMNKKEDLFLSNSEVFYMATKGGGLFFGQTGSFEPGYFFDALVIDDSCLHDINSRMLEERINRIIYCADHNVIIERYLEGIIVPEPKLECHK